MKLSVIIPTFNRADVLRRNLNLLAVQTVSKDQFEVIVVNDGSLDGTSRVLNEWQAKNELSLKVIQQNNSGQGVARNSAIEKAQGEILLFLGDDMLPKSDLLEKHLFFHEINPAPEKAALGLVLWHPEIKVTSFMRWLTSSGVQFKFDDLKDGDSVDFRRFYTSNISLKRSFLGAERFDPDFSGWGFEDAELGYRLQQKGLKLIFLAEAVVQHFHEIDKSSLSERQKMAGKNAVLFQKKHPEAKILPKGIKLVLQKIIATLLPFTFYGQAKKAFLKGIKIGCSE